jgi:hypothetical protein
MAFGASFAFASSAGLGCSASTGGDEAIRHAAASKAFARQSRYG